MAKSDDELSIGGKIKKYGFAVLPLITIPIQMKFAVGFNLYILTALLSQTLTNNIIHVPFFYNKWFQNDAIVDKDPIYV
jgi:hypothetical protein